LARYSDAMCRLCRREAEKLFLKGERCFSDKCSFDRRGYAPGQHGQSRRIKVTDYGLQLRQKQKVKRIYGLLEKQFKGYFRKAVQMKGVTGENLLVFLERRLDNSVYRMGFAKTRNQARMMVSHGHFEVNGTKTDRASFLVNAGDVISVRNRSRKSVPILEAIEGHGTGEVPSWLEVDSANCTARVTALPSREHITHTIQEQLIVELYSR